MPLNRPCKARCALCMSQPASQQHLARARQSRLPGQLVSQVGSHSQQASQPASSQPASQPASQPRASHRPGTGQPQASHWVQGPMHPDPGTTETLSLERRSATATTQVPATASQPLKSQGPPIQAQGSRNVYLFFVISCLRILKQLITRNKYTLRLPPLSWPGGSWDFRG